VSVFPEASPDYYPSRERTYPQPEIIPRKTFLKEFKSDYKDGQHLTTIGPSQRGKSRLTKEALKGIISPARKVIVLAGKPPHRERTWDNATADELNLRVTEEWPPKIGITRDGRDRNRNGFLVRPHQTMDDLDWDEANLIKQFRAAILHAYGSVKQKYITLVDEGYHVHVDLKLRKHAEAPLMRGAPDNAMWTNIQRSRFVSMYCYDSAEHVLMFRDDDRANQQRLSEIGGVDVKHLIHIVKNLRTERVPSGGTISQAAYFRRASNDVRIVDT
jgi:energy-coupling factor transporter ATP-binding protein EcfA2